MMEIISEIKEGIKGQGKQLRGELEEVKNELKEKEKKWKVKREELKERIGRLEERIEDGIKKGERGERDKGQKNGREEREEDRVQNRIREKERRWENSERVERRNNIIIRGIKREGREAKEKVEELLREIGVEGEVEEVRRMAGSKEEGEETVWARLDGWRKKREVMEKKRKLKGK